MWREAIRRAGLVPLLFVAIVVSQWVINRVDMPADKKNVLLAFIIAVLIPPLITLAKSLMRAPGTAPSSVPSAQLAGSRSTPTPTALALTALVATAIAAMAAWLILVIAGATATWLGSTGLVLPVTLLATLFVLTRQAERSIKDQAIRTRRVGFLWSIGMALMAIQIAVVAGTMGRLTLVMGIGVVGTFLVSVVLLLFLVRPSGPRRL